MQQVNSLCDSLVEEIQNQEQQRQQSGNLVVNGRTIFFQQIDEPSSSVNTAQNSGNNDGQICSVTRETSLLEARNSENFIPAFDFPIEGENVIYSKSNREHSDTCPICYKDIPEFDIVSKLKCGHHYHIHCLSRLLDHKFKECSICKASFQLE